MVYYRKYRPQSISELDSESLRGKLIAVLSPVNQGDVAHAFLFTGPKGLGKTSTARIVAKVINCEKVSRVPQVPRVPRGGKQAEKAVDARQVEPCNTCQQCISITNGTNMDVLEIDAASNRGIDEIRDLKEKVKLSPLSAKKKVYIIDEVHMLTTEAFNALLKTLEEPPAHVVFVLCTTEPQKVPATILSRCTHILFQPATTDELVRSFERIAKGEKLEIEGEVLKSIANLSDAGFRDGVKILEELVLFSQGKKITQSMVEERYKTESITSQVDKMLQALSKYDAKESLDVLQQVSTQGIDMKYFVTRVLSALHDQLLLVVGVLEGDSKYSFTSQELQVLLELLSKATSEMKFAVLPQIPIELAIVEWSFMNKKVESVGRKAESGDEIKETKVEVTTQTVTMKTLRKNLGTMAKIKALYGEEEKKVEEKEQVKTNGVSILHYDATADTKEWMDAFWKSLISEMKFYNHTLAGLLRGCHLKSYDKKSVVIEALYKFHKEKLDEVKTMEVLEKVCKQLTGNNVVVSVILKAN